ncbi:galactose oxidase [Rhizophagus clarus]|uniref:Galactose oxidase n=1 Tax=Rhizophagus clarus TaxID=94130 RepID=A0A8H3LW39_9GLOM|nr:galactose oxidase [Rhizophagus clarus]
MDLSNFLGKHRRSEPKHLFGLKIFTMIILISSLAGYLAILIIGVNQDAPTIVTYYANVDGVRPPNLHFGTIYYNTSVVCQEVHMVNGAFVPADCSRDIKQSYYDKNFYTSYLPSKDVFFSKSVNHVILNFFVHEEITQPWALTLMAYDSGRDLFYQNSVDYFDDFVFTMNSYIIKPNQNYIFTFSHLIREVIVPSWMNDFGVPPTYDIKPYIMSDLIQGPMQDDNSGKVISFTIQPKYIDTIQVDRDVRTRTYLGGLGLIGGAWGLTAAIYKFLFGTNTLRPWGAVQSYCCGFSRWTQKKLKDSLPIIPFSDVPDHIEVHQINSLSLFERNKLFLSRLNSLEIFLREYVVDVKYLNKIRNDVREGFNDQNTNSTSSTTLETTSSQQQTITMPSDNVIQTSTTDSTPQSNITYTTDASRDDSQQ